MAVDKIPIELWSLILDHVPPSPLLPPADDDLINNMKLLADDCEAAAAYTQYRLGLYTLCRKLYTALQPTRDPFLLLPESTSTVPSAFRVQFPTTCECRMPGCPMAKPPRLSSYKTGTQPLRAFLDPSPQSQKSVEDVIAMHTGLWLLSIAVDFSTFSLPSLSSTCSRLTHLSFSEFHLPDSEQDQTLDLPMLNTLILNFFSPGDTIPPLQPTQIHHSYRNWRLPSLRNLSLKGWISDANPNFINQINGILRAVGSTLQGLLYKLWILSDTRAHILHPLPLSLWDWCPHLHTIQTALKILLTAPMPPPGHPRLTFVPVHLGDLDTSPDDISNLVWPQDLLQDVQNGMPWPIDIIRISTTWVTFHRKLQGMHEASANPNQGGQINGAPSKWPGYFCDWASILLGNRYALQDRNGVDVSQGDGWGLVLWLRSIAKGQESP